MEAGFPVVHADREVRRGRLSRQRTVFILRPCFNRSYHPSPNIRIR